MFDAATIGMTSNGFEEAGLAFQRRAEWWIVSAELALKLRAAGSPVLRFGDMHLWGRSAPRLPLQDDLQLLGAIGPRSRHTSLQQCKTGG